MRLSEAIREGCKYGPQLFGRVLDNNGGSCAIGAAWRAVCREPLLDFSPGIEFWNQHKGILDYKVVHPVTGYTFDLISVIISLNTEREYRWSREAIAELVETVERKLGLWNEPEAIPAGGSSAFPGQVQGGGHGFDSHASESMTAETINA